MKITAPLVLSFLLAVDPALAGPMRVIDGDTIADGETTYRLFGIDAPEAGQCCQKAGGGKWRCGQNAIATVETLVIGKDVTCDHRGLDGYGRTLAVCLSGNVEINAALVEAGLAWSYREYSHDYDAVEDQARGRSVGIWQAETQTPWDYRAARWEVAKQEAPDGCPIKGNINKEGERIYHPPWSPWYEKTKVSVDKGERWFCDEAEAMKAGWRAPQWGR